MADSFQVIKHVELYVSSVATPSQQAASVNAVAELLKNDFLTLEALVREMEMYLTTTDSIIRSRGILLLAEVLEKLTLKPLNSTSVHSLIGFFMERLADWKALRGAIVGCLALLRREKHFGAVTDGDANAVALSYLQNLQVQSLAQHDRKLSFQLMECLLYHYSGAIGDLGDNLVYGICEAIDGEKDPQCLLLVFHIVEGLARLFPGISSPFASFAEELFDILGRYFPIHFTHPKGEDEEKQKEELSRALMLAFASTPLFEPFSVPLLLEKLSSSLPSAKVESFKYLSYCMAKYGPESIAIHADTLWSSIKEAIFISPQLTLSRGSELMGGMSFQESDLMMQAFVLLQEIIRQYGDFISIIIDDNDLNAFMDSLIQHKELDDIPLQVKQRLHVVGCILSSCAKSSVPLCNKVYESFFPLLMNSLGLSSSVPHENSYLEYCSSPLKVNFGALYLCVEVLGACRDLTVSLDNCTSIPDFGHQTCYDCLGSFSNSLAKFFISLLRSNFADNVQSAYFYFVVKGLEILATFPGSFPPVPNSIYDSILLELVSSLTSNFNNAFLWKSALKVLVEIGFFVAKCSDTGKAASFEVTVVEKIVSLISSDESPLPLSLKLQAVFEIGATRKDFMLKVAQGLHQSILTKFSAVYDRANPESDELIVKLLDTYSQKVLPWFLEAGGSEEIPLNFALSIWDKIDSTTSSNHTSFNITSDLLGAVMTAMKKAVASCLEESQEIIVKKSLEVVSLSSVFGLGFNSYTDEWLASLFASVVIALRPQASIPDGKTILQLFTTCLLNGHTPSAHALGSLVNKLPMEIEKMDTSRSLSLNVALDMIFQTLTGNGCSTSTSGNGGSEINLSNLRLKTLSLQSEINAITGLAWIGKGLLMRGHEKLKVVATTLLNVLMFDHKVDEKDALQLMRRAGDAFHVIMSDSEECLNRTCHANVRPLYKQRFFSTIFPILSSMIIKSESSLDRSMLHRALAHVVSDTPLSAILGESKKLVPMLLDCLSLLNNDASNKEIIYNVLLVVSGILLEKNGQEAAVENAPGIVNQLGQLTAYPHMTAIRETSVQCLVAMSGLPHTRIYPLRTKVLQATSKALDDPKRIVRQEAVRCRQAWASIGSRSLHF